MECFTNLRDIFHIIQVNWKTAHQQHLGRALLESFEGDCTTFCLTHSIWANQILLLPMESDGSSKTLPIGAKGNSWYQDVPWSLTELFPKASQKEEKVFSAVYCSCLTKNLSSLVALQGYWAVNSLHRFLAFFPIQTGCQTRCTA